MFYGVGHDLQTVIDMSQLNQRKGTRGYTPKPKAQPPGAVALRRPGFLLIRKSDRPKPWANFVVFLPDEAKRKRSFHVAWNGARFNSHAEVEALQEREPEIFEAVEGFLRENGERYVRPHRSKRRRPEDPGHGSECSCYDCQEYRNENGE